MQFQNDDETIFLPDVIPSDQAFLDWLRPQIDDGLLDEIAAAEVGYLQDEHFRALYLIRQGSDLPSPLPSCPREVLELKRWIEPDDPVPSDSSTGRRAHLLRAFCCVILLRDSAHSDYKRHLRNETETLIQFVASAHALGADASQAALQFLYWRLLDLGENDDALPFFALGILLLASAMYEPGTWEVDLISLADRVISEEAAAKLRVRPNLSSERFDLWLYGLLDTPTIDSNWRTLAEEVFLDRRSLYPHEAATPLRLIGEWLVFG